MKVILLSNTIVSDVVGYVILETIATENLYRLKRVTLKKSLDGFEDIIRKYDNNLTCEHLYSDPETYSSIYS